MPQETHADKPEVAPYVPALHALHAGAPARAKEPGAHAAHVDGELAPTIELDVPFGQGAHAADD